MLENVRHRLFLPIFNQPVMHAQAQPFILDDNSGDIIQRRRQLPGKVFNQETGGLRLPTDVFQTGSLDFQSVITGIIETIDGYHRLYFGKRTPADNPHAESGFLCQGAKRIPDLRRQHGKLRSADDRRQRTVIIEKKQDMRYIPASFGKFLP